MRANKLFKEILNESINSSFLILKRQRGELIIFCLKSEISKTREVNLAMMEISDEVRRLEKIIELLIKNKKAILTKLENNGHDPYERQKYEFQLTRIKKGHTRIIGQLQEVEN